MAEQPSIRVGVGVMILKEGMMLLGKRRNAHGAGEYAFPGGHLEHMESFADCAIRETHEECGIDITNIRFQFLANIPIYAPRHYTHIGLVAEWKSGEPVVLEPEKCEAWGWYALDALPAPLFGTCVIAVESHRTGVNYFDQPAVVERLRR